MLYWVLGEAHSPAIGGTGAVKCLEEACVYVLSLSLGPAESTEEGRVLKKRGSQPMIISGILRQPPGSHMILLDVHLLLHVSLNPVCICKPLRLLLTSPPVLWNVPCVQIRTQIIMYISAYEQFVFHKHREVSVSVHILGVCIQCFTCRYPCTYVWGYAWSKCLPRPWLLNWHVTVTLLFLPVPL